MCVSGLFLNCPRKILRAAERDKAALESETFFATKYSRNLKRNAGVNDVETCAPEKLSDQLVLSKIDRNLQE